MSPTLLCGTRVLDLSTVVVGPVCTLRLADYGAEVIKIEPLGGDLMRTLGGPSPTGSHSGSYLHLNRGKRAVCLDLKNPTALDALYRIVETCDVLVANMRPDALERLGLDPASVHARRPSLVHCTITGFGPGGSYRGKPAYDSVVQGGAGIAALFEQRDGEPRYAPMLLTDHVVGEIAAGAVTAALVERERTGVGATIEVPMLETMAAFVLHEHLGPATFVPALDGPGDRRVLSPDNRPLRTADGWISVTANSDAQAAALLTAIGREDLIDDPRFHSVADRFANVDEWLRIRQDALAGKTTAAWLRVFADSDVAAMPCHSLTTLLDDPHLVDVELVRTEPHLAEGTIRAIRPTLLIDGSPAPPNAAAHPLGWDTREVLLESGIAESELDELVRIGAAIDGRLT